MLSTGPRCAETRDAIGLRSEVWRCPFSEKSTAGGKRRWVMTRAYRTFSPSFPARPIASGSNLVQGFRLFSCLQPVQVRRRRFSKLEGRRFNPAWVASEVASGILVRPIHVANVANVPIVFQWFTNVGAAITWTWIEQKPGGSPRFFCASVRFTTFNPTLALAASGALPVRISRPIAKSLASHLDGEA